MINTLNHKEQAPEKKFNTTELAQKSYDLLDTEKEHTIFDLLKIFETDYNLKYPGFLRELGKREVQYLEEIKNTIESFEDKIDNNMIAFKLQHERDQILEEFLPKDREKVAKNLDFICEFVFCTLIPYEKKKKQQALF